MNIPSLSYAHIPVPHALENSPDAVKASWRATYGPFFATLKEELNKQIAKMKNKLALASETETDAKMEAVASDALVVEQAEEEQTTAIRLDQAIIPFDPKTILKKLDNGFTYYIRQHDHPSKETASLRLVVRVGSTDEQEHERGMAHLLEHLVAEYDTESYTRAEIRTYLQSVGAIDGKDQNASTTYNETVYKLDIPLQNPEVLDKTLHMMSEWASKSKLLDAAVNEERATVLDEILNKDCGSRYVHKRDAVLFEGTPYPERDPAGLAKVIQECTPDQVRAFYKRFYQPNNMSLVAVGDFDAEQVEGLIKKHFAPIPASPLPEVTHDFSPIEHEETRFVFHRDPEASLSLFQLFFPIDRCKSGSEATLESVRQGIINALFHLIFNSRLKDLMTEQADPPFIYAKGEKKESYKDLVHYVMTIAANHGALENAFKHTLHEIQRACKHGFLASELEEAKAKFLSALEELEKEKHVYSTRELAQTYVDHFTDGDPAPDLQLLIKIKQRLLPFISLENVNLWARLMTPASGNVICVLTPESSEIAMPSEETLRKIIKEEAEAEVAPYNPVTVDRPLLRTAPTPGKIVNSCFYDKVGVTQWNLENGMRVFVRPSTLKENEVLIYMSAKGGTLSGNLSDRPSSEMAEHIIASSGVAGLSPAQLKKILKHCTIEQKLLLDHYLSGFSLASTKKDLETALQLLHARMTDPGYRQDSFATNKKEAQNLLKFRHHDPDVPFYKTHVALCTQDHPAFMPLEPEEIEKADYDTAVNFLQNRLGNPANFDLVIVGNVRTEELQPLMEKYFAGIPKTGERTTQFELPGYEYPPGIVKKELIGGVERSSKCHLSFPAPIADDKASRQFGAWTASLVGRRLLEKFRYAQGKTYGAHCEFSLTTLPGQNATDPCSMEVNFTALPENMQELTEKVTQEIALLQKEGFTEQELAVFKTEMKEARRQSLGYDILWLSLIVNAARWDREMNQIEEAYLQLLEQFSLPIAQELVTKLFPLNRYTQVTMHPKSKEPAHGTAA